MDKITYENIGDTLIQLFPEYKLSKQYFEKDEIDSPYTMVGNLGLMIFEDIDNPHNIDLAQRLLRLTDQIMNSSEDMNSSSKKDNLINVMQIEVFEKLVGSKTGAILARKLLHGKSLELLQQTLKHYHTDSFLEEWNKNSVSSPPTH